MDGAPGHPQAWSVFRTRLAVALLAAIAAVRTSAAETVRVATFNVSLYGEKSGDVLKRLETGTDPQAKALAEIIQRVRPQILLVNEIDYDANGDVVRTFHDKYVAVAQNVSNSPAPAEPIDFSHRFTARVNTGRHSGFDLNKDGVLEPAEGNDAHAADGWGYGRYEGQYGMAILSQFPIDKGAVRTFQNFRWKDMPDAKLPDDPNTPAPGDWYPAQAVERFPLSSKSHWDVPVAINGKQVHVLASHPTPPVYDGAEDRNGRRNHDEVRFWRDYVGNTPPLTPPHQGEGDGAIDSSYIYDDAGARGGLKPQASRLKPSFIILGDLNGDPFDGEGKGGISLLLASPQLLKYPPPESDGGEEQARLQRGANARHRGNPRQDTCDPADAPGPGNLRLDYVLPSADLKVAGAGVFWPKSTDPLFKLVGVHPFPSSDHRLVWIDLEF